MDKGQQVDVLEYQYIEDKGHHMVKVNKNKYISTVSFMPGKINAAS